MAKQRIKQAAIEAAQDKTEVTAHIRTIGDLNREIKRLETEAGDKKAVIEEEYAALAAPLKAESERLTAAVAAYCEAHKDDLTENGKTKTVDFVTGLVKWRIRPPSVKVTGVAAVLAWMSEKTAYKALSAPSRKSTKTPSLMSASSLRMGKCRVLRLCRGLRIL